MKNLNLLVLGRKYPNIRIIQIRGGDRLCLFYIFDFFTIMSKFFILKTLSGTCNNYKLSQTLCYKRGAYE